ncbi:hypothetical protein GCM10010446_42320 [Streptomyces enissocaesilis]|uniref:Uncharacterized protein n=1 Tax=Streptomyces enissocaesilis TaxID=332589 RepID=A0ABN3XFT5_9ACTN
MGRSPYYPRLAEDNPPRAGGEGLRRGLAEGPGVQAGRAGRAYRQTEPARWDIPPGRFRL